MNESPEQLLEESKTRKLTAKERRRVIAHIDETSDKVHHNTELGAMFNVSEKTIREDKQLILAEYTSVITPEYAMMFVGSFLRSHDDLIRKTRAGLDKCLAGTMAHQGYLKLLSDLESKRMKILQDIGAVPKELGHLNVTEERWVASVSDDGIAEVMHDATPSGLITDGQLVN